MPQGDAPFPRLRRLTKRTTAVFLLLVVNASLGAWWLNHAKWAVLVLLAPALLAGLAAIGGRGRAVLVFAALGLNLIGIPFLQRPLPHSSGHLFPADVVVAAAFMSWFGEWLIHPALRGRRKLSPMLGWPLIPLSVAILFGVVRGHQYYGASLLGQPLRFVAYAGIALAVRELTVDDAWHGLKVVLYAGAVIQSFYALYYIATGGSQTQSVELSTGGVRVLALSTATYLTAALIFALLEFELRSEASAKFTALAVASLSLFGIIVSFGRTTYFAVALILPLLIVVRKRLRANLLLVLPLLTPAILVLALLLPKASPNLVPTLQKRLTAQATTDFNFRWRKAAQEATLKGLNKDLALGVGFGRPAVFSVYDPATLQSYQYEIVGDPHNSFVYILAGGGAFALGSFLFVLAIFVWDALRRLRRSTSRLARALIAWSLATWFAFILNSLAGPVLTNETMLLTVWVTMLLPAIVPLEPREQPAVARTQAAGSALRRAAGAGAR